MNSALPKFLMAASLITILFSGHGARATLAVQIDEPQWTGSKAFVKISMRNTGTNAVQSARAVLFLFDEKGKVVGHRAEWVIGGTRDKPGLAPEGTAKFHFAILTKEPVKKTKLTFTRIILDDGRIIEAGKGYTFE
jgi:hypothetical protein